MDLATARATLAESGKYISSFDLSSLRAVTKIKHLIDDELLKIIDNENSLRQPQSDYCKKLLELYIRQSEIEIEMHKLRLEQNLTLE